MSPTQHKRTARTLLLAATIAAATALSGCVVAPGYGYGYGGPAYVYAPPVYVHTGWGWGHGWGGYHRGWR